MLHGSGEWGGIFTLDPNFYENMSQIFQNVIIPVVTVWAVFMAYATCVYITKQAFNLFRDETFGELAIGSVLFALTCACYGVYNHIKRDQDQVHNEDDEEDDEGDELLV